MKVILIWLLMVTSSMAGILYICRTPTSVAIFREITGMTGDPYTDKGQVQRENHAKRQSEPVNLQPDVFDTLSNAEKATHVTNFATFAVPHVMTFESENREQDFSKVSKYFQQPDGWNKFQTFLKYYRVLKLYPGKPLKTSAVTLNDASITDYSIDLNGKLSWILQVPIEVTFDSGTQRWSQCMPIEIVVSRPDETSPSGHPMSVVITKFRMVGHNKW